MRYSLLSRFQGAICAPFIAPPNLSFVPSLYLAVCESLISHGGLSPELCDKISNSAAYESGNSSFLALLLLPVFVFFHDNQILLQEKLTASNLFLKHQEQLLVFASAIALAMDEKTPPQSLVPKLVTRFPWEPLKIVDQSLRDNVGLSALVTNLNRCCLPSAAALAISLYCFTFSAENFAISVNLAKNTNSFAPLTVGLTAAISGSYNSHMAIPALKRLALKQDDFYQTLFPAIKSLFLAWAGVAQTSSVFVCDEEAIASPGIIQSRSSLKLISQGLI